MLDGNVTPDGILTVTPTEHEEIRLSNDVLSKLYFAAREASLGISESLAAVEQESGL